LAIGCRCQAARSCSARGDRVVVEGAGVKDESAGLYENGASKPCASASTSAALSAPGTLSAVAAELPAGSSKAADVAVGVAATTATASSKPAVAAGLKVRVRTVAAKAEDVIRNVIAAASSSRAAASGKGTGPALATRKIGHSCLKPGASKDAVSSEIEAYASGAAPPSSVPRAAWSIGAG